MNHHSPDERILELMKIHSSDLPSIITGPPKQAAASVLQTFLAPGFASEAFYNLASLFFFLLFFLVVETQRKTAGNTETKYFHLLSCKKKYIYIHILIVYILLVKGLLIRK